MDPKACANPLQSRSTKAKAKGGSERKKEEGKGRGRERVSEGKASAGRAKRKQYAGVPEPIRVLNSCSNGFFIIRAHMDSLVLFYSCYSSLGA